ncbi:MAG: hypothetical protein Q8O32_02245 [bacterium]|nr:hypothetical protein [bacterium]
MFLRSVLLGVLLAILTLAIPTFVVLSNQRFHEQGIQQMENGTIINADIVFRAVMNYIEEYEHCPLSAEGFVAFLPQGKKLNNFFTGTEQSEARNWMEFLRDGVSTPGGIYYQSLPNGTFAITAYGGSHSENGGPLLVLNGACPRNN